MKNNKETVEQLISKAVSEAKVDIDVEYCKQQGIKFNNHEINASEVDLFNTKSNQAAFDLVMKNR